MPGTRLKYWLSFLFDPARLSNRTIRWLRILSIALLAGVAIAARLIPGGGFDWYRGYMLYANDPFSSLRPTWIYLILEPITHLPHSLFWFTLLNTLALAGALFLVELPHPLLMLTLPVFWVLFYGQIDGWFALGAVLGWYSIKNKKPISLGLALVLLSSKPHLGFPIAIYYMIRSRNWRMFIWPAGVLLISMLVYGLWPLRLLQVFLGMNFQEYTEQTVNISLWPWSLILLLPLIWRWHNLTPFKRSTAVLALTYLTVPYSPVYTLIGLLFLTNQWPVFSFLLLPAWGGRQAAQIAGILFTLAIFTRSLWPDHDELPIMVNS